MAEDDKKLSQLDAISSVSFLYGVDDGNISGKLTKEAAIAALNLITEAPANSQKYARVNEGWTAIEELSADVAETISERWNFEGSLDAKGVCLPATAFSSGFVGGASVTVNAGDPAAVDITFTGAVFVDASTCTYKAVDGNTLLNVPITNIGVQPATYIGINENGSVIQQATQFDALQRRTIAFLAAITHVGGTVIENITERPIKADDVGGLITDYLESVGPVNISGNDIEPFDATLKIKRLPGQAFGRGINFPNSAVSPNIKSTPLDSPVTFFSNYRNAGSGVVIGITDSVDPNNWDDGSGTLVPLTGNDAVAHRIYFFPGSEAVIILYGQKAYGSVSLALSNYLTEIFENRNNLGASIFLGWLILQNGITDLTAAFAAENAYFIKSAGSSAGAGGGSFYPSADQDITGEWTFQLGAGKKFILATDPANPASTGGTFSMWDHDPAVNATGIVQYLSVILDPTDTFGIYQYNIVEDVGDISNVRIVDGGSGQSVTDSIIWDASGDSMAFTQHITNTNGSYGFTVQTTDLTAIGYIGSASNRLIDINFDAETVEVKADPTTALGVATKQYVDSAGGGTKINQYLGTQTTTDVANAIVGNFYLVANDEAASIVIGTPLSPQYGDEVMVEGQGAGSNAPDISAFSGATMGANETVKLTWIESQNKPTVPDAWFVMNRYTR